MNFDIVTIIISPDHNFVGHYGAEPGTHPAIQMDEVKLTAGRGIEGDRYAKREPGHRGQITFFAMETIDMLKSHFQEMIVPSHVRRNVFVRGVDLPDLVGRNFKVNGIEFQGVDPCPPCHWMDTSVGMGAKDLMEGKGGLRARILTDGILSIGPARLEISSQE